jgi:hypothetical protein
MAGQGNQARKFKLRHYHKSFNPSTGNRENRLPLEAERDKQVYPVRIDGKGGKQTSALRHREAVE